MEENSSKNKVIFKIINKSKDGCTIFNAGRKALIPWDEMKEKWVISADGCTCTLTDKEQQKWDRADELLTDICVQMLSIDGKNPEMKLSATMQLPSLVRQLSEMLEIPETHAMELARQRYAVVRGGFRNFSKPTDEPNQKLQKTLKSVAPKANKGECLGDNPVLQQLKAKMEANGKD